MSWNPMIGSMRLEELRRNETDLRRSVEHARLTGPLRRPRRPRWRAAA
jgi:hypothetical protein